MFRSLTHREMRRSTVRRSTVRRRKRVDGCKGYREPACVMLPLFTFPAEKEELILDVQMQ